MGHVQLGTQRSNTARNESSRDEVRRDHQKREREGLSVNKETEHLRTRTEALGGTLSFV